MMKNRAQILMSCKTAYHAMF